MKEVTTREEVAAKANLTARDSSLKDSSDLDKTRSLMASRLYSSSSEEVPTSTTWRNSWTSMKSMVAKPCQKIPVSINSILFNYYNSWRSGF